MEQEQKGKERSEYGKALMDTLSAELTREYGKSYSKARLLTGDNPADMERLVRVLTDMMNAISDKLAERSCPSNS